MSKLSDLKDFGVVKGLIARLNWLYDKIIEVEGELDTHVADTDIHLTEEQIQRRIYLHSDY